MTDTYRNAILDHYSLHWGTSFSDERWTKGPIHQLPETFSVIEVPPHGDRDMWTYATCCMSQLEDPQKREVFLYSPHQRDQHVELLTILAHYHRTGSHLDLFHSVNFGRPWLPGSSCSYGLLSWAYLEPREFAFCLSPKGDELRFLWLIPITEAERDYKMKMGNDALEEAFEKASLNYLDPKRKSVV